jgi:RluA family pseudouridine synthase
VPTFSVEPNPKIRFKIRYHDDHVVVIDKPHGLVTQPGKGHERDTLLNGLFAGGERGEWGIRLQNLGADRDFGLLHRLDRETSGLLIAALSREAYDILRGRFESREIRKFYFAICARRPRLDSGVIKKPILEVEGFAQGDLYDSRKVKIARIHPAGKPAVTAYRVLDANNLGSLIEARPVTGRLHQVRVHLDAIGCPILSDGFYAPASTRGIAPRLALHAHRVVFDHPINDTTIDTSSPFPKDLKPALARLRLTLPEFKPEIRKADSDDDQHPASNDDTNAS